MTTPRATLLLALALAAAGCTKLYDTASLDPLASAGGYCRTKIDAHYDFSVRCFGYDPTWSKLRPRYWYHAECDQKAAAVAAGRMTYDRASGEACLAAYREDTCTEPEWANPACAAAIAPAVLEGGECVTIHDCVAPGWCSSPDGTCPGHCIGFGAPGAACAPSTPCGQGLWCDGTNTCAPRKGPGEPCADNCLENLSCAGGACTYVAGYGGSCATMSCDPFQPLYCDPASTACLTRPTYGQPCATGDLCDTGFYCNTANQLCYPVPTVAQPDGQPCPAPYFCGAHSWCDPSLPPATCKARRSVGESCTGDTQCLQPAICDTSGPPLSWVCKGPAIAGTACTFGGTTCATGTWCKVTTGVTGTCTTEPDVGQPCGQIGVGDYASCIRGHCALAIPSDAVGSCRLAGAAGAACTADEQCESWSCDTVAGTCRSSTCPLSF